jgi:hypothetical protein
MRPRYLRLLAVWDYGSRPETLVFEWRGSTSGMATLETSKLSLPRQFIKYFVAAISMP